MVQSPAPDLDLMVTYALGVYSTFVVFVRRI
jgi:hypothetical protein